MTERTHDKFKFTGPIRVKVRLARTFAQEYCQDGQILQRMRDSYLRLTTTKSILDLGAQVIWKHDSVVDPSSRAQRKVESGQVAVF